MLYIHIPYCHRKCTYCAFYSQAGRKALQDDYVEAVCDEIAQRSNELGENHSLRTVYLGGGTPSILTLEQLQRIFDCIRCHFDLSQMEEVTMEANPEDLSEEYLSGLRALAFINRLSIGVQSFHDSELKPLNRVHNGTQAIESIERAHRCGFDNLTIDLIYGLPKQTLDSWRANLDLVATLPIKHLSCYALTVEQGSMLSHQIEQGRVELPNEELALLCYDALLQWCDENGFEQYELSNFCKPSHQAVHNSRYWNRTPYIGIGAGAHSFDGRRRRWHSDSDVQYIEGAKQCVFHLDEELITPEMAAEEYVMTALRTKQGMAKAELLRYGCYNDMFRRRVEKFVEQGLLTETKTHISPTRQGMLMADGMAVELCL